MPGCCPMRSILWCGNVSQCCNCCHLLRESVRHLLQCHLVIHVEFLCPLRPDLPPHRLRSRHLSIDTIKWFRMKKHNNTPIQSGRCITLLITAFLPVDGDGFHFHMGTIYTDSVHRTLASLERGAFCVLFSVFWVQSSDIRVQSSEFRVQSSEFRV